MSSKFKLALHFMKTIYQQKYQNLIELLIKARKDHRLTQIQVAKKLEKPQSYIAKVENKDRKLDVLEYLQLCEALNISASDLLETIENS